MGNGESTEGCDIVTLAWETAKGYGERRGGEAFSIAGSAKSRSKETAESKACWFGFEAEELALKLVNKAFEGFFKRSDACLGAVEEKFLSGGGP
jgi:hypothetical protein